MHSIINSPDIHTYLLRTQAFKYAELIVFLTDEINKTRTSKFHVKTNVLRLFYSRLKRSGMTFDLLAVRHANTYMYDMIRKGVLVSTQIYKPRVMTFVTVPIKYTPRWYKANRQQIAQDIMEILCQK